METESEPGTKYGKGRHPNSQRAQFKPGERHGKAVREGEVASPLAPPLVVQTLYEEMLWVRTHRAGEDVTEGQRDMRRWKARKPLEFLSKFADLEKAALTKATAGVSSEASPSVSGPSSPDVGLGRVVEQVPLEWELVEWIDEHRVEVREWAVSRGYKVPGILDP